MKKVSLFSAAMLALVFSAGSLYAGSVDALGNLSAEYVRSLSRNASTDADAATYNPAGIMLMEDGLYGNAGCQYLLKDYSMTDNNQSTTRPWNQDEYSSDVPSIIPNAFLVFKKEKWAAFATFNAIAGGGEVEYKNGSPMIGTAIWGGVYQASLLGGYDAATAASNATLAVQNIDKFKASSQYLSWALGGAYKLNDMFSVALGGRIVYGSKDFDITAKQPVDNFSVGRKIAEVNMDALGFTGIVGVDVTPTPEMVVALRYESVTKMNWDTDVTGSGLGIQLAEGLGYGNGETEKKDLPQLLSVGLSYKIIPDLKASASFTYYMIKWSTWEHFTGEETNKEYDNGFDAAISLEYTIMPELLVSAGYMYTKIGSNEKTLSDFEMALDANVFALGARYELTPGLLLNAGFQWAMYIDGDSNKTLSETLGAEDITYSKDVKNVALGVQFKFM